MEPYSTLEHHNIQSRSSPCTTQTAPAYPYSIDRVNDYHDAPETVPAERLPQQQHPMSQKEAVSDSDGIYGMEIVHEKGDDTPGETSCASSSSHIQSRGIKALRSNRWFIAISSLLALVLIGSILGGVLGTKLGHHDPKPGLDDPQPGQGDSKLGQDEPHVRVHNLSRLSASNWTSEEGVSHKVVWFQDEYQHIIARRWDGQSKTWTTANVTRMVGKDKDYISPMAGTSLASVSSDFNPAQKIEYLFYLNQQNLVSGYVNWHAESESETSPATYVEYGFDNWQQHVFPESELAATYQYYSSSINEPSEAIILAYQEESGEYGVGNDSAGWSDPLHVNDPAIKVDHLITGNSSFPAPIGLSPFWNSTGSSLEMVYQTSKDSTTTTTTTGEEATYLDTKRWRDAEKTWAIWGHIGDQRYATPDSVRDQHLAVSRFHNMQQGVWFLRQVNGTVWAKYHGGAGDGNQPVFSTVHFRGFDDERGLAEEGSIFDTWAGSIAAAHGGLFYGVSGGGRVLEYVFDEGEANVLKFSEVVYP